MGISHPSCESTSLPIFLMEASWLQGSQSFFLFFLDLIVCLLPSLVSVDVLYVCVESVRTENERGRRQHERMADDEITDC